MQDGTSKIGTRKIRRDRKKMADPGARIILDDQFCAASARGWCHWLADRAEKKAIQSRLIARASSASSRHFRAWSSRRSDKETRSGIDDFGIASEFARAQTGKVTSMSSRLPSLSVSETVPPTERCVAKNPLLTSCAGVTSSWLHSEEFGNNNITNQNTAI